MNLSALAGNTALKERLSQRELGPGLSHAYIISGPRGSGRHTLAGLLCQAMLCQAPVQGRPCGQCGPCKKVAAGIHPDVVRVSGLGEGKPITVDQVRTLRSDAYVRPNEGERKIYLLEQADTMNSSAQNAMLKLLEEGPAYAAFLLLSESEGGLLQTVRSRCQELILRPVSLGECRQWLRNKYPDRDSQSLEQAALECQGLLGRAVELLEGGGDEPLADKAREIVDLMEQGRELELFQVLLPLEKLSRDELGKLMDQLSVQVTRRLPGSPEKARLMKAAQQLDTMRRAVQLNANPGQLLGWFCALLFLKEK